MTIDPHDRPTVESQRMSVVLLIVLVFATCGLYAPVWFLQRRRFLNGLDTSESIGDLMPTAAVGLWSLGLVVGFFAGFTGSKGLEGIDRLITMIGGFMMLMMSFKAKRMIEQHMLRIGQHTRLSGVATFFLQLYYLQYHINRMPETSSVAHHFD